MNEQYEVIFKWAEENRNTFEPLYRKDARRHYNETPFTVDLLADFIVETQSLLKRAGYDTMPTVLLQRANKALENAGWYFRFTWIDEKTGNYLTNGFSLTPKQRAFAEQVVDEVRNRVS